VSTSLQIAGLLILTCVSGLDVPLSAQSYSHVQYSVPEGLPSAEVYDICQDKKGFIWFATDNGVVRFDGHDMLGFQAADGLPDPVVFGFFEDVKGRVWFRSYSGKLSYFDGQTIKPYRYNRLLDSLCHHSLLYSLYVDSKDQVWFGTNSLSGRIGVDGRAVTRMHTQKQIVYTPVENGFIQGQGISVAMIDEIKIGENSFKIEPSNRTPSPLVNSAQLNGKIYFAVANSIFTFDAKKITCVFKGTKSIINLSIDQKGALWVGYLNGGAQRFLGDDFTHPLSLRFLANKSVTKVIQDRQGGYWVSTLTDGVYYIPNLNLTNYSLPDGGTIVIAARHKAETLIGDDHGHLFRTGAEAWAVEPVDLPTIKSIHAIFTDAEKKVWISAPAATYVLDSSLHLRRTIRENISDFFQDQHRYVWATTTARIIKFTPDGDWVCDLGLGAIHRSALVSDSLIFMTKRLGFDVFNRELNWLAAPEAFSNQKISTILELKDSCLLLSTIGGGFFVTNRKTWKYQRYSLDNKFTSNNIYTSLLIDSMLWLGTDRGIAITPIGSLLRGQPTFTFVTKYDGLCSNDINKLVHSGSSVLAFSNQMYSILPEGLWRTPAPTINGYLKGIRINGLEIPRSEKMKLRFDQNNIQINLGFINFNNRNIFLRYRLSNAENWNYSLSRSLTFYSLAPGNYDVELHYSIDNIRWIPAINPLPFSISPPWWQTWQLKAGLILLAFMVMYFSFRGRVYFLRQRMKHLRALNEHKRDLIRTEIETQERERRRIARDLHDSLGMNLTTLKMSVSQALAKHNEPLRAPLDHLFLESIQELKGIIYGLAPPSLSRYGLASAMREYIEKLKLDNKIEFSYFGNEIGDLRIETLLFRIIQELISNALRHSQATHIEVHINSFDDLLNVVFEDNGIGFDLASAHRGFGLLNIESRVQSVNGHLKFESSGLGTSCSIDIPLPFK